MMRHTREQLRAHPWCRYCDDDGRLEVATSVGWIEDPDRPELTVAVSVCALHRDLVQASPTTEDP